MSLPCMNRVWQQSNQQGAALFLLIALADCAPCFRLWRTGANGCAWPGVDTLALKTRLSSRHVSRLVPGLPHRGRHHLYIVLTGTDTEYPLPPLSRLCFQIMSTSAMFDPIVFRSFHAYFNPNLPAKFPHVPPLFPKKSLSHLLSLPNRAQQPAVLHPPSSVIRPSSIIRRQSSFIIHPPPHPPFRQEQQSHSAVDGPVELLDNQPAHRYTHSSTDHQEV